MNDILRISDCAYAVHTREIALDRTEYVHDNHSINHFPNMQTNKTQHVLYNYAGVVYNTDKSDARSTRVKISLSIH